MAEAKTKTFKTRTAKNSILLEIYFKEGGNLPQELSGLYTDKYAVDLAIAKYQEAKNNKKSAKAA